MRLEERGQPGCEDGDGDGDGDEDRNAPKLRDRAASNQQ